MECPATVHETVCVQAAITIFPHVTLGGEIQSHCVDVPMIGGCDGEVRDFCTFTVSQNICVEIPLVFSATATAVPAGIVCGTPLSGECPPPPTACTYTVGYYKNNLDLVNSVIAAAGGSVTLGKDMQGLSFIATAANAGTVLSGDTPSPPTPSDPPFRGQYRELYAQLLAANLNYIRGATCDPVLAAISAANKFLATSPPGGVAGAPDYQVPLAQYNKGEMQGCPVHC